MGPKVLACHSCLSLKNLWQTGHYFFVSRNDILVDVGMFIWSQLTLLGKHHPLNKQCLEVSCQQGHPSYLFLWVYRYQNRLTSTSQTDVFNNMNVQFLALLDTPMTQLPIHQVISQCCPLTFIPQIPIAIPTSSAETWSPGAHQCAEAAAAARGCLPGAHREVPGRCGPGPFTVKVGKMT